MIKTLFTSYTCDKKEPLVQEIISKWKQLNPSYKVLYFSDDDVRIFFKDTPYFGTYIKMRNGVAVADFFRVCYINKYGGCWFDIDIEPCTIDIKKKHDIQLFDCGWKNISYMLIGGNPNQILFTDVIHKVVENIENNIPRKKQHVIEITGPGVIQNIIFKEMNIVNKDGCFPAANQPRICLSDEIYEFCYNKINLKSAKTNIYKRLQRKYQKKKYQLYNYV